jgi:hypothetical protein
VPGGQVTGNSAYRRTLWERAGLGFGWATDRSLAQGNLQARDCLMEARHVADVVALPASRVLEPPAASLVLAADSRHLATASWWAFLEPFRCVLFRRGPKAPECAGPRATGVLPTEAFDGSSRLPWLAP